MYKLTQAAKNDLTNIINTILFSQDVMDDCARRGQWKRYHKVRDEFHQAILDLYNDFQIETFSLDHVKKEIKRNVSTN